MKYAALQATLLAYSRLTVNGWGANGTPPAPPPLGPSPAPDAVPGGGPKHGGPSTGHRKNPSTAGKGETRTKFVGNTTEMKGHVFQPRNVSKNANQYHDTVEVLRQYVAKEYETGSDTIPTRNG